MRREFFIELYNHMNRNSNVWALTGDLGYGGFDKIREEFPDRFINCGAAEQAMMGIAVGLTLQGKIVFVYSITPFLLCRPYETIRNYIDHEKIPVKLVGSGRDNDYAHDGFSHNASDDMAIMRTFPNIQPYWPNSIEEMKSIGSVIVAGTVPTYLNLRR